MTLFHREQHGCPVRRLLLLAGRPKIGWLVVPKSNALNRQAEGLRPSAKRSLEFLQFSNSQCFVIQYIQIWKHRGQSNHVRSVSSTLPARKHAPAKNLVEIISSRTCRNVDWLTYR
jgi:hypothetical protein